MSNIHILHVILTIITNARVSQLVVVCLKADNSMECCCVAVAKFILF